MKKSLAAVLAIAMVVALAVPVVATAQGGKESSNKPAREKVSSQSRSADKAQRSAAKSERKVGRTAEKAARKAAQSTNKASRKAMRAVVSDEMTDSIEPTGSVEATRAVGPGVSNAFARITANIEKSLAKVEAGTKKQVPPGLIRVWLKFAGWLGVDAGTMPGTPTPEPTSTVEPTGTVEPTSTVEPTTTIEPTSTVDSPLDGGSAVTPTP